MVSCEQANSFIDDYLSGDLPRKQRRIFNLHIRMCKDCDQYLQDYQDSISLYQGIKNANGSQPCDPPIPEEIIGAIVAAKKADN